MVGFVKVRQFDGAALFSPSEPACLVSVFPKDTLTKSGSGRMSHL